MSPLEFAALTVDCAEPAPVAAFWKAAAGGEIIRHTHDTAWVTVGRTIVIFRRVEGYRPPTWPLDDIPMQFRLEFFVDDLDEAELELLRLGATTSTAQPVAARDPGLRVMVDPAGHPFCIGLRA